jgi:hypothetical protein
LNGYYERFRETILDLVHDHGAVDRHSNQRAELGEVAEQSHAEWLIGNWKEVGNESTTIGFTWELDKHAIVVQFTSGATNARGLITYRASANRVDYVAADNQGATGTGRWVLTNGHPTLLYEQTAANGKKTKAGFVHKKIDDKTMVIEVYELTDRGELSSQPLVSPRFTRQ